MLDTKVEQALNAQIEKELTASLNYLAMAVWCDNKGLDGCAKFFYRQSEEEHMHMMKIIHYLIERNALVTIPAIPQPVNVFQSIYEIFDLTLEQEISVTHSINEIISTSQQLNDHSTQNFLQWYVTEQREEEAVIMKILDRIKLIGKSEMSLYYIDQEVEKINKQIATQA